MRILVTGATGFIGRQIVPSLLDRGHELVVAARDEAQARRFPWFDRVEFEAWDLFSPIDRPFERFGRPDAAIHLAWPGLPNYAERFHLEKNFPADRDFLESLLHGGLGQLLVTGTCAEYGMQSGSLSEDLPAQPVLPYALAKDLLRRYLVAALGRHRFTLQWARLFYIHGEGQNPKSLLASLDHSIVSGAASFNMSGGAQLKDYLPVEEAACRLVRLLERPECDGVVNVCSGIPVSVLEMVKSHLVKRNSSIEINTGYYPYSETEPMASWGDDAKYRRFCA